MKEKIFYTTAALTSVYGAASAGYELQQGITASNSLEATLDQQAAAEHTYKEENPEATQMPVDIQNGPAEYASLLNDRVDETRTYMKISLGIGVVGALGLIAPTYVRLRRERKEAIQGLIDQNEALHAKQEQDIEVVGQALQLLGSQAEFDKQRDDFAKNTLAIRYAMALDLEDLSSETGVPQDTILRTAVEIGQAIDDWRSNQGVGGGETSQPAAPSAAESSESSEDATSDVAPEQPTPQPVAQAPQAPQPAPRRAETATPEKTPAPVQPAPPRVHRARRS